MLERLVLLDLGHDGDRQACLTDVVLDAPHVLRRPHERDGDPVDALRDPEVEVLEIAIGDRFELERAVGIVDPLPLAQLAAGLDDRVHVRSVDRLHAQRDRTVGEVDALADLDVAREARVTD